MTTLRAPATVPLICNFQGIRPFTLQEYHQLIASGILDPTDRVELLEGYIVVKMARNPPHDGTIQIVRKRLTGCLPAGWDIRIQSAVTLAESEPEPDLALVRGDERAFLAHHPGAADVGLIVEVADSSLYRDRIDKVRIYARAAIPHYWIVNLVDQCIEVYSEPSGATENPGYAKHQNYGPDDPVPFLIDGAVCATFRGRELLP